MDRGVWGPLLQLSKVSIEIAATPPSLVLLPKDRYNGRTQQMFVVEYTIIGTNSNGMTQTILYEKTRPLCFNGYWSLYYIQT